MQRLNTIFLGIIAAVALGAAIIWWSGLPTRQERNRAASEKAEREFQKSLWDLEHQVR